jgi:hypothetical protein
MSLEADAASESRRHRLPRTRLLTIGVVCAVVLAAGIVGWRWRHPDVSFEYGYGMSMTRDVGSTVWTTLADSDEPGGSPITFTGLEPIFKQDGAEATVEYVICELDPTALEEDRVGGFGYGLPTRYVERYCLRTSPAEGADLVLRTDVRQELLAGITATQPGRTVISGHHVTYRMGWQRGSGDIGVTTQLTARQPN